jgi:hypothetical protein
MVRKRVEGEEEHLSVGGQQSDHYYGFSGGWPDGDMQWGICTCAPARIMIDPMS